MKRFVKITILLLAIFVVSCSPQKRIERVQEKLAVEAIENISGSLSGGWVITLRVRNQTGYSPVIKAGEGEIYSDNVLTAYAALTAPVTIPKKSVSSVDVPLNIKLHNPLRAISLISKLNGKDFAGIELSLSSEIEVMGIKRQIETKRVSAAKIFEQLGFSK